MKRPFELTIRNDHLGEIIGRVLKESESGRPDLSGTIQKQGEALIGTYAMDMVNNGVLVDTYLDFTYDTLSQLPKAVRKNLIGYMERNPFPEAVSCVAKSLAAYFFCLSMNEHGSPWTVKQLRTRLTPPSAKFGPLWGNCFQITTGSYDHVDFLPSALEGTLSAVQNKKGSVIINLAPLNTAYLAAFHVDLQHYGLADIGTFVDL